MMCELCCATNSVSVRNFMNSVTVGNYTNLSWELKGGWGGEEEEGLVCFFFCSDELNWMNWLEFGEQVSVLTCSIFYFSATMATAPYNYSYIFKYIIIGKYQWLTLVCVAVWIHERPVAVPPQSPQVTTLLCSIYWSILHRQSLEFMLKAQVLIGNHCMRLINPCQAVFLCLNVAFTCTFLGCLVRDSKGLRLLLSWKNWSCS